MSLQHTYVAIRPMYGHTEQGDARCAHRWVYPPATLRRIAQPRRQLRGGVHPCQPLGHRRSPKQTLHEEGTALQLTRQQAVPQAGSQTHCTLRRAARPSPRHRATWCSTAEVVAQLAPDEDTAVLHDTSVRLHTANAW